MSSIPYSKSGTAPRKKRRESPKLAVRACYKAGKRQTGELFACAIKRNGPWSKEIYTRVESQWVQRAHTAARRAEALSRGQYTRHFRR